MLEDLLALCALPGPAITILLVPQESHASVLQTLALSRESAFGRTLLMGDGKRLTVVSATTSLSPWDVVGGIPYRLALMGWGAADSKDLKGLLQWRTHAARVYMVGSTMTDVS